MGRYIGTYIRICSQVQVGRVIGYSGYCPRQPVPVLVVKTVFLCLCLAACSCSYIYINEPNHHVWRRLSVRVRVPRHCHLHVLRLCFFVLFLRLSVNASKPPPPWNGFWAISRFEAAGYYCEIQRDTAIDTARYYS